MLAATALRAHDLYALAIGAVIPPMAYGVARKFSGFTLILPFPVNYFLAFFATLKLKYRASQAHSRSV